MQCATSSGVGCTINVSVVLLWLSICYVLCCNVFFNTFHSLAQITNSLILIVEASIDVVYLGAHGAKIVAQIAQIRLDFSLHLIYEVLEHVHSNGWCRPAHCLSRFKGLVVERITLLVI